LIGSGVDLHGEVPHRAIGAIRSGGRVERPA
jgi:hypothetical protein